MPEKKIWNLKIDPQFKELIRPLRKKEYLQLEQNILEDGCRDPIVIWEGFIIDGHNRYEICKRHQIPFAVVEKAFSFREEVVAWICANQLGRRNISEETRKFLIGKQYQSEKLASKLRNPGGVNQYSTDAQIELAKQALEDRHQTATRIAQENNVSRGTVEKYAIYSRALDTLSEKDPEIASKILSGQYKIAHQNVVALSKLEPAEIRRVGQKIKRTQEPFVQYHKMRSAISAATEDMDDGNALPTVKDMPAYDPDADINALALTIPSWVSSVRRVTQQTDMSVVSQEARDGLAKELNSLLQHIEEMLSEIEEN